MAHFRYPIRHLNSKREDLSIGTGTGWVDEVELKAVGNGVDKVRAVLKMIPMLACVCTTS